MKGNFIRRSVLARRLRVGVRETYKLFPVDGTAGPSVPEDKVLAYLNAHAEGLPSFSTLVQFESDRDVVASGRIKRDGKPATLRLIRAMAVKRSHNPIPHVVLGKTRVIFPLGIVGQWLDFICSGVYVSWRKYSLDTAAQAVAAEG